MSSQQYSLVYAEEERADDTREQDEFYSIGNYDFDPSYEFDNGPREDEQYFEEENDYYDLPFEQENDHYSQQEEEYDHFHQSEEYDTFQQDEDRYYIQQDEEYDHFQQEEEYEHFQQEEEYDHFQQEEEYDHFQQEEDYYQEVEFQEQQESMQEEISDQYYEEESYWADLEEEEQHNYENEELEHDFEIQALEEMERENQLQAEAFFASEQERLNHQQQQQQTAEYEYQLQQEHDQQIKQRDEMQRIAGRRRGYNHFADQITYRLRDHIPDFVEYRHDLGGVKQKNVIDKPHSFHFVPIQNPKQNLTFRIIDKGSEIVRYPFQIALETTDKILTKATSKLAALGFTIGSYPIRSLHSKYQKLRHHANEKRKYKNIKENVIDLYYQGFSKSKITEFLGVRHEAVTETLDDFYKSFKTHSNISKTVVSTSRLEIDLEKENKSESEVQVDDDIQEIISMYQQGYSAEDIARILSLQLPYVKMILNALYFSKGSQKSTLKNSQIPFSEGTHSRYVDIGFETILFPKYGPPIQASDLQRLTPEELKAAGPFLMFDENNTPVYSHIHSVNFVKTDEALRVTSLSGIDAVVGVNTKSLYDELAGIKSEIMKETEKSYCFIARDYSRFGSAFPSPFELLKGGHLDIFFRMKRDVAVRINQKLNDKYPSMREACRSLDLKYSRITDSYHKRSYTYKELLRTNQAINYPNVFSHKFLDKVISIGAGGRQKKVNNFVKPEFFNVLGLIASDGYIGEYVASGQYRIGFANKDEKLLKKFKKLVLKYFPEMTLGDSFNQDGVPQIHTNNYVFTRITNNLMIKGSEVEDRTAFLPIFRYSTEYIAQFLKGYFDGDGGVNLDRRTIQYTVHKKKRAQNLQLLLKRFDINSSLHYRWSKGKKGISKVWDIHIFGKSDLERFIINIQSNHTKKRNQLRKLFEDYKDKKVTTTNRNRAPLIVGSLIKAVRLKLGLKQVELGKSSTISQVENLIRRTSMENLMNYINIFKKQRASHAIVEFKQLVEIINGEHLLDEIKITKEEVISNYLLQIETMNRLIVGNGLIVDKDNTDAPKITISI